MAPRQVGSISATWPRIYLREVAKARGTELAIRAVEIIDDDPLGAEILFTVLVCRFVSDSGWRMKCRQGAHVDRGSPVRGNLGELLFRGVYWDDLAARCLRGYRVQSRVIRGSAGGFQSG